MHTNLLTQLTDHALLRDLETLVSRDRTNTAAILVHLGEVDARRLYAPEGYPSMFAYCVGHLHLSEGAAYKRIQAARAAREFPLLLEAIDDGRLHLSAVCVLRPHLTMENAAALVEAATHRSKAEVEQWVARHLARAEDLGPRPILRVLPARRVDPPVRSQLSPGTVDALDLFAAPQVESPKTATIEPESERYLLRLTIDEPTQAKLREAQELLSHSIPSGDLARVLNRVLDLALERLHKAKYGVGRDTAALRVAI